MLGQRNPAGRSSEITRIVHHIGTLIEDHKYVDPITRSHLKHTIGLHILQRAGRQKDAWVDLVYGTEAWFWGEQDQPGNKISRHMRWRKSWGFRKPTILEAKYPFASSKQRVKELS